MLFLGVFIKEALNVHNYFRTLHGVAGLSINPHLTQLAQEHAETIAKTNKNINSKCLWGDKQIGENIAVSTNKDLTGKKVADLWYSENKDYDYSKHIGEESTKHFTQMIWKETKEVGFGVAKSDNGDFYVVANYYPKGNNINEFELNVLHKK